MLRGRQRKPAPTKISRSGARQNLYHHCKKNCVFTTRKDGALHVGQLRGLFFTGSVSNRVAEQPERNSCAGRRNPNPVKVYAS